jgi:DNA (cytosine-5)-methyltransferase 1
MPLSKKRRLPKLTSIDLFAGCGGLSLGLEQAGFHPIFVSEINSYALESYLMNRDIFAPELRDTAFHAYDVKDLLKSSRLRQLRADLKSTFGTDTERGDLDLIAGGPPCQGFSGIGYRRSYSVERRRLPSNRLFADMATIIKQLHPKIFLFENVRGLLTAKWTKSGVSGEIWHEIKGVFSEISGYSIADAIVYGSAYGVPQNRPRVLLVGVRSDVNVALWNENPSGIARNFLPAPSGTAPDLIDLLGDLEDPRYENGGETRSYPKEATHESNIKMRTARNGRIFKKGERLTEHDYSAHSARVLEKFKYMIDNDGDIHPRYRTRKFSQRLLPRRWGRAGPSITATSLPDDYVHYKQPRILTVREWARLQGFPDWYQFAGPRTTGGLRRAGNPQAGLFDRELPKYTQIGNAVPIELARKIGVHFANALLHPKRRTTERSATPRKPDPLKG